MTAFTKGQMVRVKAVTPEGPVAKFRMDDDGKIWYLVTWTADGIEHERWFGEEDLVSVG